MTDYKVVEHNVTTGKISVRKINAKEISEIQQQKNQEDIRLAKLEAEKLAKESGLEKLAALGLSPEEISAITGS